MKAEAVEQTLATIRNLGTTGGILIFTYVHAGVLDGSVHFQEARRWLSNVKRVGEPWTFGWRPEDLAEYLEARRFILESTFRWRKRAGICSGNNDAFAALQRSIVWLSRDQDPQGLHRGHEQTRRYVSIVHSRPIFPSPNCVLRYLTESVTSV